MSAYVPQVGDRVRLAYWPEVLTLEVRFIDDDGAMYGRWSSGDPGWAFVSEPTGPWLKVEPPVVFPEVWACVYRWGVGMPMLVPPAQPCAGDNRIGVIHLHPDGTVEMEAP